jgi:hypothetical protein
MPKFARIANVRKTNPVKVAANYVRMTSKGTWQAGATDAIGGPLQLAQKQLLRLPPKHPCLNARTTMLVSSSARMMSKGTWQVGDIDAIGGPLQLAQKQPLLLPQQVYIGYMHNKI